MVGPSQCGQIPPFYIFVLDPFLWHFFKFLWRSLLKTPKMPNTIRLETWARLRFISMKHISNIKTQWISRLNQLQYHIWNKKAMVVWMDLFWEGVPIFFCFFLCLFIFLNILPLFPLPLWTCLNTCQHLS